MTDTAKHDALNRLLDEMIEPAMLATQDWCDIWHDAVNYVFCNQLYRQRRREGWDRIQVNYIWPSIRQELAVYAQRRPILTVQGYEAGDQALADMWQAHIPYLWDNTLDMPKKVLQAALDAKLYGYCVAKTTWDERGEWDAKEKAWKG